MEPWGAPLFNSFQSLFKLPIFSLFYVYTDNWLAMYTRSLKAHKHVIYKYICS